MHTLTLPRLLLLLFFLSAGLAVSAQNYTSAVGLRLGYPWAASYKTFISEKSALEAYAGFRGYSAAAGFSVNGAYLIHNDIDGVDNLQWYAGGGAGVRILTYDFFEGSGTSFNVSGYIGLEYTLEDAPISFSFDWIPTIYLGSSVGRYGVLNTFGGRYGGLAARYVIGD